MTNTFEIRKLGEIISIAKGKKHDEVFDSPTDGSKRYIQIDDLRTDSKLKYTTERGIEVGMADVIIAWDGANAGTIGFGLNGYIGSTLARLRILNSDVYPDYVGRFLRGKSAAIREKCSGATIPYVDKSFLQSLEIPLPPLPIQKQIAAILEKADGAREKRRQANQLTEQFLQSAFLEMFGDPVTNPKGWERKRLGAMAERFSDGPFGSNLKTEHYTASGIRIIRLQNIGVGELIDDDKAYISEEHFSTISKHTCLPGDVLIGTLGDPNLRACILPSSIPIALNKADCIQMRPKKGISNSQYVCWLVNQPGTLTLASGMIHGQTRARINMGRLRDLAVPCPPLHLQQKFAALVEKVEGLRVKQRKSEKELEYLFQSLMQRAFKGELVG